MKVPGSLVRRPDLMFVRRRQFQPQPAAAAAALLLGVVLLHF